MDNTGSAILLAACILGSALAMLIAATAVFGDKYHYVGLERYYLPLRPLYFALFVLPFLAVRIRGAHLAVALPTLATLVWVVQVDWTRAYSRTATTQTVRSPYGQWVRSFGPDPSPLLSWLDSRHDPGLVVISNYHEYLALEIGLATLPIPRDRTTLETWLANVRESRGIDNLDAIFVLDPDNRWRSHWIPDPEQVMKDFGLTEPIARWSECDAVVFRYAPGRPARLSVPTESP